MMEVCLMVMALSLACVNHSHVDHRSLELKQLFGLLFMLLNSVLFIRKKEGDSEYV